MRNVFGIQLGGFVGALVVVIVLGYLFPFGNLATKKDMAEIRESIRGVEEALADGCELALLRNDIRKHWDDYLSSDYLNEYSETDRQLITMAINRGHPLTSDILSPRLFWDVSSNISSGVPFGLEFSVGVDGVPAYVVIVASLPPKKEGSDVTHVLSYVVYGFDVETKGLYRISRRSLWCKFVEPKTNWLLVPQPQADIGITDKIKSQAEWAFTQRL